MTDQVVAIDGKTVRRSHCGQRQAIHLVSAYAAGLGMVPGQVRTADKSNAITAIAELLDALQLKWAMVTIDAMGCQRNIARRIRAADAHYVLAVKGNQPGLLACMRTAFDALERFRGVDATPAIVSEHREAGKGHGRIETRRCVVTDILANPPFEPELWPGLRSIALLESTGESGEIVTTERRCYVSSMAADARRIAHAVRSHWGVESMHWVLDVTFNEDQCRARVENAAQNFAILRRIAANLIKSDISTTQASIRIRRLKAGADDNYRAQLLGLKCQSNIT